MRGANEPSAGEGEALPGDRFASFRPREGRARVAALPAEEPASAPKLVARDGFGGMTIARYDDGGRLLRNAGDSRRPDPGAAGLLSLGTERVGGRTGIQACDPYRGEPRRPGDRVLALLVDTSSSIVEGRRQPAAIVCGAGAAIAALRRGHAVAVANFSSSVRYLKKTRDATAIYQTLASYQKESTRLPPAHLFDELRGVAADYVLVTDAAIANAAQVAPGYARLFRATPTTRARLFLLGTGLSCEDCAEVLHARSELCKVCRKNTLDPLKALVAAGFRPEPVEHPAIAGVVRETLARLGLRVPDESVPVSN